MAVQMPEGGMWVGRDGSEVEVARAMWVPTPSRMVQDGPFLRATCTLATNTRSRFVGVAWVPEVVAENSLGSLLVGGKEVGVWMVRRCLEAFTASNYHEWWPLSWAMDDAYPVVPYCMHLLARGELQFAGENIRRSPVTYTMLLHPHLVSKDVAHWEDCCGMDPSGHTALVYADWLEDRGADLRAAELRGESDPFDITVMAI